MKEAGWDYNKSDIPKKWYNKNSHSENFRPENSNLEYSLPDF